MRGLKHLLILVRVKHSAILTISTFLTQPEGHVGPLQVGSQMYGILTEQSECARALLLSLPAAFSRRHRSVVEIAGLMKVVRSPFGTTSLRAHHAYAPSTSH